MPRRLFSHKMPRAQAVEVKWHYFGSGPSRAHTNGALHSLGPSMEALMYFQLPSCLDV